MAVSFKVPKSPKRSIFNMDTFLGVDLTNSGSSIEETRSPNADNMVRFVPGKVRKRTGYTKDVIFGKDVNVNCVKGTSSVEQDFVFGADDTGKWVKILDMARQIRSKDGNAYDVYYEFDYKCTSRFWISTNTIEVPSSDGEWAHFSYVRNMTSTDGVTNISVWTFDEQDIFIKNMSVMYGKDASYKWTPAPNYFVERANNDPVYGVHIGKTGTFEGNRVVNVNRVLSTTNSFETYNVTTSWQDIKDLGEYIYPGTRLYIELDYRLTGDDVTIWGGGATFGKLTATSTTEHFSANAKSSMGYSKDVKILSDGTSTLEIKCLSIMYQVDQTTYDWSVAPEDNGETFHIEDVYLVGSQNYATATSYDSSDSANSTTHELDKRFQIEDATSKVEGFVHISFNLHTASFNTDLNKVEVWLVNEAPSPAYAIKIDESNEHYKSKQIDCYVSSGVSATDYINKIGIVYKFNSGGGMCWTYISDIQVNEVTPRSSYDISPKWYIYHVGTDFYLRASNSKDFTKVYSSANQHLSKSWQFNQKLFLLDGKDIYSYAIGDETVQPIGEENGYIPTLTIAKSPTGGGVAYEPLNMLQPGFYETFYGDVLNYHLSFGNLDSTPVKAWIMDSNGIWQEKVEGTDFNVNRGIGMVSFFNAVPTPPITGEDNVKILAYRTVPGYKERITKCTNGTLFGVGGAEDRLFLTGNPDYPNWDFYSEQFDPTYFPDTGYAALGSEQSAIVGYALVNNYLAAFKDGFDTSQSVFIREGDLVVSQKTYGDQTYEMSEPAFKLINTLQGNGVIAPYAFGYLQTEPLFLTKSGIYAITAQDITGEKYSQNRSFYLNGALTKENNLEDAVATTFNDMYVLAINNQLYILDGLQATRTDKSEPYATRQYVGFYCKDVPAVCLWTDEDALWFGTGDGKVCFFKTDIEDPETFNDDGKEIYCCWETPDLDGRLFYKNKTFRYFAIRMMKALRTSVALWSEKLGAWTFIKEDRTAGLTFDFENVDFEAFSFSTDRSEKVVHTKVRVKKVDKARFRVENGRLNEPFGLIDLALEYIESGNYKG